MDLKYKIGGGVVVLAIAFACGRYSVQAPTVHTIADIKTDTEVKTDKDVKKTTVVDKKTTGEVVTTITEEDVTKADKVQDQVSHLDQTITPPKLNTLNISALIGTDPLNSFKPLYGLSVTKQFLGPITVGAWGLTNSTVGLSIGINF